jgi:hypothetical protein
VSQVTGLDYEERRERGKEGEREIRKRRGEREKERGTGEKKKTDGRDSWRRARDGTEGTNGTLEESGGGRTGL